MRSRAASHLVAACGLAVVAVLAGCNDDGRTLREPRPDQTSSVSTTAPPTTVLGDADTGIGIGDGDGGLDSDQGAATLPAESVVELPPEPGVFAATWADGAVIHDRHTCTAENVAPALSWSPAPTGTVEIAVTLVDQNAPEFVHWVMSGIDPFATSLAEGAVPEFAITGVNSNGTPGYTGPCPPAGEQHTYVLTLHFLDQVTELSDGSAGVDLQAFVNGATFASLSLVGTYSQG